jgi:hypothetical protein
MTRWAPAHARRSSNQMIVRPFTGHVDAVVFHLTVRTRTSISIWRSGGPDASSNDLLDSGVCKVIGKSSMRTVPSKLTALA